MSELIPKIVSPKPLMQWRAHATRFIFLLLGLMISVWAFLVPYAKLRLSLNEAQLGTLIFLIGLGSLVSMVIAGVLTSRYGCRITLIISSLIFLLSTVALAFVDTIWLFGLSLFMFGLSSGVIDVAMNIQAVLTQNEHNRPMMSGFHALFSLGSFIGVLCMMGIMRFEFSEKQATLFIAIALAILLCVVFARFLFNHGIQSDKGSQRFWPKGLVLLLGSLCFILYMADGVVMDWASLFLITHKKVAIEKAGLAFGIYSAAMAFGRFYGDRFIERVGLRQAMILSVIVAFFGFLGVIFAKTVIMNFFCFIVAGLGMANLIPSLFSIAGQQKQMRVDAAITTVTIFGYLGLLLGPAIMGHVAYYSNLFSVFYIVAACLIVVGMVARSLSINE